jgi:outer membrane protein assembly factor BamB
VRAARTTISCRSALLLAILILFEAGRGAAQVARTSAPKPQPQPQAMAQRWRTPLPSGPSAPPTTDGRLVFIALRAGRLSALTVASGRERWSVELESTRAPAVGGGMLFVTTSNEIRALAADTGEVKWRFESGPVDASPVWREGWLIAGIESGEILAIRSTDGKLVWRRAVGRLSAAPAVDGDRVVLPLVEGRVALADLATGEERWSRRLGGSPGRVLVDDDRVFVGAQDNFFYCLDARSGGVSWRWRTAADVVGLAAVDAERVYFVSLDNVLRALDRFHGSQRWQRALVMRALDGPVLMDDRILVSGLSADVALFDKRDGSPAGRWTAWAELGAPVARVSGEAAMSSDISLVAIAGAISGEWAAVGVGLSREPPLAPLSTVPGTPLPPEVSPRPPGSSPPAG